EVPPGGAGEAAPGDHGPGPAELRRLGRRSRAGQARLGQRHAGLPPPPRRRPRRQLLPRPLSPPAHPPTPGTRWVTGPASPPSPPGGEEAEGRTAEQVPEGDAGRGASEEGAEPGRGGAKVGQANASEESCCDVVFDHLLDAKQLNATVHRE